MKWMELPFLPSQLVFFALTEGMETITQIDHSSFILPTWRDKSFDMDSFVDDVQSNLIQNEHDESESKSTSSNDDEVKVDNIFQNLPKEFQNLYTSFFSTMVSKCELLIRICDLGLVPRNLFGFSDLLRKFRSAKNFGPRNKIFWKN